MSAQTPQTQPGASDPPLVAVVDDDASCLRSVGRLLRASGYRVELFGSAPEFLASLGATTPQCLVLDVQMPEMPGLQLHDRLVAQGSSVPIVFVTACDTPQTRAHAHRPGIFGLLLKPFDKEALLSAVREAVKEPTVPSSFPRPLTSDL